MRNKIYFLIINLILVNFLSSPCKAAALNPHFNTSDFNLISPTNLSFYNLWITNPSLVTNLTTFIKWSATNSSATLPSGTPGQYIGYGSAGTAIATNIDAKVGYFTNGPTYILFAGDSMVGEYAYYPATNNIMARLFAENLTGSNWLWATNASYSGYLIGQVISNNYATGDNLRRFRPAGGTNGIFVLMAGVNNFYFNQTALETWEQYTNAYTTVKADGWKFLYIMPNGFAIANSTQKAEWAKFLQLVRNNPAYWDYLYDLPADIPQPPNEWLYQPDGLHATTNFTSRAAYGVNQALLRGLYNRYPLGGHENPVILGPDTVFDVNGLALGKNNVIAFRTTTNVASGVNTAALAIDSITDIGGGGLITGVETRGAGIAAQGTIRVSRVYTGSSYVGIYWFAGLPEGAVDASLGTLGVNTSATSESDLLWLKTTALGTTTGWKAVNRNPFGGVQWVGPSGTTDAGLKRFTTGIIGSVDNLEQIASFSATRYYLSTNTDNIYLDMGAGNPEGAVTAAMGSLWSDSSTGYLYTKTSGSGNTGWYQLDRNPIGGVQWVGDVGVQDTGLKRFTGGIMGVVDNLEQIASFAATRYYMSTNTDNIYLDSGAGTPEGAVTASVGSIWVNTSTGDLYVKTSGTGNTGWTLNGSGFTGAVKNTGTPAVGNVPYYSDTTGTNIAPSSAFTLTGTNASLTGTLYANDAVFTNGIVIGAGGTNLSVTGNVLANGGQFTNSLTLNGNNVLTTASTFGGNVYNNNLPTAVGQLAVWLDTTKTNVAASTNIGIINTSYYGADPVLALPAMQVNSISKTNDGSLILVGDSILYPKTSGTIVRDIGTLTGGRLRVNMTSYGVGSELPLTPTYSGNVFDNHGATARQWAILGTGNINNLPNTNNFYTFEVTDSDGITIIATNDCTIIRGTTVSALNGTVAATNIGSTITLYKANETNWVALAMTGDFNTDLSSGSANWTASGTTNSTLTGNLTANGGAFTNTLTLGGNTVATSANNLGFFSATTSAQLADVISDETGSGALVFGTDPVFTTSMQIPNGASPTTDAFGEIAGDNNAWAASRGAPQWYDGTANTYLIGTLVSDTPTNGQVPKWNTGGTVTWENDGGTGGGYCVQGGWSSGSPADSTTYYVGFAYSVGPDATEGRYALMLPQSGTIKSFTTTGRWATLSTSENVTVDLWLNNATSIGSHTETWDSSPKRTLTSGLSQAVTAGDYLELRIVTPAWVTNPSGLLNFIVYIE